MNERSKQLDVELRGQPFCLERFYLQSSANNDGTAPSHNCPISSSYHNDHNNNNNNENQQIYSRNRNEEKKISFKHRPMSCKPGKSSMKKPFQTRRISSAFSSFNKKSLHGIQITNDNNSKDKPTAVAWAENTNQTSSDEATERENNDVFTCNEFQQNGAPRIFQKRDKKDKVMFDDVVSKCNEETQLFHRTGFPTRRMTMSLQHQTFLKAKKNSSVAKRQTNQSQKEAPVERMKFIIPVTSTEPTVYDSIETERLLRLNLADSDTISNLREELMSTHPTENRKFSSIMAPPSSPRLDSPTPPQQKSPRDDFLLENINCHNNVLPNQNSAELNERRNMQSSLKNGSIINICDASTVLSSSRFSLNDAQNAEDRLEKVLENERTKGNRVSFNGWLPTSVEEGEGTHRPVTDIRVRSVQLLCTHSGRLRHTATLIETHPVTSPSKHPPSDREGGKNVTQATNRVFVSKTNYKPIKMVYEDQDQALPQETGIPAMMPHLQRYFTNLQKKQLKLEEERAATAVTSSVSLPLADGIYKTIKTYEFGLQGPQETVEKTLICKTTAADRRPKTSNPTPKPTIKSIQKARPQSGPSRLFTNQNFVRKSSSAKIQGKEKETKNRETKNSNEKEFKGCKMKQHLMKGEEEKDEEEEKEGNNNLIFTEPQPNQIIPRVHFESQTKNKNPPSNSILKNGAQETVSNPLPSSLDFESKRKNFISNNIDFNPKSDSQQNKPENNTRQSNKNKMEAHSITKQFSNSHCLDISNSSPNSFSENKVNKEIESHVNILFNGIGASSDIGHLKEIPQKKTQKSLEGVTGETLSNPNIDCIATNSLNKSEKEEKKRVSFLSQGDNPLDISHPNRTFTKEKDRNDSNNLYKQTNNPSKIETNASEFLTTSKLIQPEKEKRSDTSPLPKDCPSSRRFPADFSIYRSPTKSLSSEVSFSEKDTKTEVQTQSTKIKSGRKSPKKIKGAKARSHSKPIKYTGPPVYLNTVHPQNPIDDEDFECEKLSEKLMDNGVYVSWKTIRGGLYPPTGRSLHYEIADTGLLSPSELLSHPKNWFPKEYKELQHAQKTLERAELFLWKQKRAEDKKLGPKRKKKQTKKKKK